jgi:hypothetical protein
MFTLSLFSFLCGKLFSNLTELPKQSFLIRCVFCAIDVRFLALPYLEHIRQVWQPLMSVLDDE